MARDEYVVTLTQSELTTLEYCLECIHIAPDKESKTYNEETGIYSDIESIFKKLRYSFIEETN